MHRLFAFASPAPFAMLPPQAVPNRYQKMMKKHLGNNHLKMVFDFRKIKSERHFLHEMADFFEFPSYFGRNWSAMDDCMRDLSWLPEEKLIFALSAHTLWKPIRN